MKLRIFYHFCFWLFFTLIFVFQNPESSYKDQLKWLIAMSVMAMVVYTHLYFLLPRFFFKGKYLIYSLLLIALVIVGSSLLTLLLFSDKVNFKMSFIQDCVNLFVLIVLTSSLKFFREFLLKKDELVKVENEQLKTELAILKSQVSPHFLFNTLNNLYGLILVNKNAEAADITLKLSDLMRYLLESSTLEKVSLRKEVHFIENYLVLEKIRLANNAEINLEISIGEKDVSVAPFLFITLVENTFKHGLQSISENSFAHFSLSLQENELYFEARNSVGGKSEIPEQSQTGLQNLKKRLALIYPENHHLQTELKDGIFKATLQINL